MTIQSMSLAQAGFSRVMAAALALTAGVSASTHAQPAWRATANQAPVTAEARLLGNVEASRPISIAVVLKPRNPALLKSFVEALYRPGNPSFHQWMNQQETRDYFSPTRAQAQAVADYLRQQGFTQIEIAPNRLAITAQGTAGDAIQAFHTAIGQFQINGRKAIANLQTAEVPAALPQIDHVLGLATLRKAQTLSRPADTLRKITDAAPAYSLSSNNGEPYYFPEEFATVYHAGNTPTASNTDVAIIGWGDMRASVQDLNHAIGKRHQPRVSTKVVTVGQPSTDNSNEGEWALDLQAIAGISGGVKSMTIYTAEDGYSSSLLSAINRAVSDNIAKVINMSWSIDCESSDAGWADSALQMGAAQGQTFVNAAGDNGAYPCSSGDEPPQNGSYGDQPGVGYPSSSPYVVAVGGTTLHTSIADGYLSESAWAYSGGGVSSYEAKPDWQKSLPGSYRRLPDLAFDADWTHSGMAYYLHAGTLTAGWYVNGGTSLAAPLFTGAWARLESASDNKLGFAAPAIYSYANSLPLHDVTQGSNGYYQATAGWDNATGWGSFDIQAFKDFISSNPRFSNATH